MTIQRPSGGGTPTAGGRAAGPEQLDLVTLLCGPTSLVQRFRDFHENNPIVYATLVRLAREWVRQTGRRRLGIAALWERMRWELSIKTTEESPRLNNDYKAFYSRLIMAQEEDLAGVFETRASVADQVSGEAA